MNIVRASAYNMKKKNTYTLKTHLDTNYDITSTVH